MSESILPQAAGYGVVVGMGFAISFLILGFTKLQTRYTAYKTTSAEEFNSASRSVPPGLIAAGIVSAWTWAATLLQSSATAYRFGVSGPYWYASGAVVQVLLFAMLASKLKMNAPYCHTFLEIIRARWGTFAHIVFLFFGLATNIIVSTMLILGGSATVHDLTGANTVAVCFLIPLGVSIYVLAGGMRASLIADYSHSLVLYAILLAFSFTVYATSPILGSPARVWELLDRASEIRPVEGNAGGSYLTLRSKSGLIFGVLNIVGNFGTVFNDQAYWQRAIASTPHTSVKAFLWGGIAWFGIPMGIATSMGLAAVTLANLPEPLITLTPAEVSAGLPAVKAAAALMGQSGALAMLFLLFLAVTSAVSTEQVAVSNILTYDIYAAYINAEPTEKQILWVSRVTILGYCFVMGAISTAFNYIGVSMGYLYVLMGCIIGCAVVPVACCVSWRRCNGRFAVAGAIIGFITAISGWLGVTSALNNGVITVATTFQDYPMLTGNLLSIGVGGIITVGGSLISPADFDWEITRAINNKPVASVIEQRASGGQAGEEMRRVDTGEKDGPAHDIKESTGLPISGSSSLAFTTTDTKDVTTPPVIAHDRQLESQARSDWEEGENMIRLKKAFRFAAWSACSLTLILIIIIPLPLFVSSHIYPVGGFTAYIVITILWLFVGLFMVGIYPIWEAREGLMSIGRNIVQDLRGKRRGQREGEEVETL